MTCPVLGGKATPAGKDTDEARKAGWLPNGAIYKKWMRYTTDAEV